MLIWRRERRINKPEFVAEFNIGNGTWEKIENNSLKINVEGKVPKLEIPFSLNVNIEKLNNQSCKVNLTGSVEAETIGKFHQENDNELKIIDLDFNHKDLKDISIISITRWKKVETRVSFYNVSSKLKIKDWLETWWV